VCLKASATCTSAFKVGNMLLIIFDSIRFDINSHVLPSNHFMLNSNTHTHTLFTPSLPSLPQTTLPFIPLIILLPRHRPTHPSARILLNSARPHRARPPRSHPLLSRGPGLRKAVPKFLLALINRHISICATTPRSRWSRRRAFDEPVKAVCCALRTCLRAASDGRGCKAGLGCEVCFC
jgi:hypothetical protein